MYIVVAGITTLGRRLVKQLEERHDVVVIDEDQDKCERLYASSGATVINKDPSTLSALEDAGITDADALISALNDDNQNMVVCSLAKKYGVPKVISKVVNDEYMDAFEIIEAETIAHTDLMLSEFLSSIEHPHLVKLANLPGDREILKASIREDSSLAGKTVEEIKDEKDFPKRFKIVSILQGDKTITEEMNVNIDIGDNLILIGPASKKEDLNRYFKHQ